MSHEDQALLEEALLHLSLDQQIAMELYYWEELEIAEVASVLGIAPGTVKSRLARGRRRLAEVLETLAPGRSFAGDGESVAVTS